MTATATTTDKEADLRVAPGDGRLNPVNHIVRIVVVRPDSDAPRSHGSGHSHDLTDRELRAAEEVLKNKDAPPASDGTSGSLASLDVTSTKPKGKPKNLFEALTPTDIVVVGREPASVRKTKEGLRLSVHDDHNRDTVLRVWTESDTIEYQCDEEFEIVQVERAGWKIYDAPDDPFGNGGPYMAQQPPRAQGQNPLWVWRSGLLPARANNQQYKMTFKIKGELIDPDVVCGDPPPSTR